MWCVLLAVLSPELNVETETQMESTEPSHSVTSQCSAPTRLSKPCCIITLIYTLYFKSLLNMLKLLLNMRLFSKNVPKNRKYVIIMMNQDSFGLVNFFQLAVDCWGKIDRYENCPVKSVLVPLPLPLVNIASAAPIFSKHLPCGRKYFYIWRHWSYHWTRSKRFCVWYE